MDSYIKESDFFKGNDPEEIADEYGTPVYVYSEEIIRSRMKRVAGVITKYPYTANYSVKANTNIHILKLALEEGLNCDAMSFGEIALLLKAGFPPEKIFFVSNNVSKEEMRFAIDRGVTVSLDSLSQLQRFGEINRGGRCAVRINPGVGAGHNDKVVTAGKNTKFAIAKEDIGRIFEIAREYDLKIIGINQHIGSGFLNHAPYIEAVSNLLRTAHEFKGLEFIDFGGGYGIPYHKLEGEGEFPIEEFKKELEPLLDKFVESYGYALLFKSEPGRYCVAEGGVILSRVQAVKQNSGIKYVGCDAGMNTLIRPAMYDSYHDIEVIRDGRIIDRTGGCEKVNVSGPICESGDLLAVDRLLPEISEGDILCILDAGAYGYSMASTYNSRPRPAEVMVCADGSIRQIRRRETIEDLAAMF